MFHKYQDNKYLILIYFNFVLDIIPEYMVIIYYELSTYYKQSKSIYATLKCGRLYGTHVSPFVYNRHFVTKNKFFLTDRLILYTSHKKNVNCNHFFFQRLQMCEEIITNNIVI